MASMDAWANILEHLKAMEKNVDAQQRNLYIVAGVLGAVVLLIIFGLIALLLVIARLKASSQVPETKKKGDRKIGTRPQSVYARENMQRNLVSPNEASDPARWQRDAGVFEHDKNIYEESSAVINRFSSPAANHLFMSPTTPMSMPLPRYSRY